CPNDSAHAESRARGIKVSALIAIKVNKNRFKLYATGIDMCIRLRRKHQPLITASTIMDTIIFMLLHCGQILLTTNNQISQTIIIKIGYIMNALNNEATKISPFTTAHYRFHIG